MADRIVQLTDANGDNIYPINVNPDNAASIEMSSTDPGEGSPLAANHYIAYYGSKPTVQTSTTGSITLDPGKWFIIHWVNVRQVSTSSAGIYIYNLGNADSNNITWAVPTTSGQNFHDLLTRTAVKTFTEQTTCTNTAASSSTNYATMNQYWVAIPVD